MKTKTIVLAFLAVTAGVFGYTRLHNGIPSDLRDAVADNREFNTSIPVLEKDSGNLPEPKAVAVEGFAKGYVSGTGGPSRPVEWVAINGGKFTMGISEVFKNAMPSHEVVIKTFDMSKTAVTVEQYKECFLAGQCTAPGTGDFCNWDKGGRQFHPVNCVDWNQANQYARFKGARLPSESEWEYAATSGGKNPEYPWGNDEPACDKAVMYGNGGYGCGKNGTLPVLSKDGKECSRKAGQTKQGLCDMSGNVWQWVQDKYQNSYTGVPADGRAVEGGAGSYRVIRGGSFNVKDFGSVRADVRVANDPGSRIPDVGFRVAMSR